MYEIITLARMCEKLQALPTTGGILDQDAYTMYMLIVVYTADAERAELDNKRKGA